MGIRQPETGPDRATCNDIGGRKHVQVSKQTSKLVVAKGPGWALAWPRDEWERLTAAEQQAVIDRQTALLSNGRTRPKAAAAHARQSE